MRRRENRLAPTAPNEPSEEEEPAMSFMNDLRMRYRITIALVLPTVGLIMAAGIIVYDKLQVVRQMEQV